MMPPRPALESDVASVPGSLPLNLLYVGDITDRPTLDEAYYRQLFRGESHFVGRETYCTARGDSRCEIVARRP